MCLSALVSSSHMTKMAAMPICAKIPSKLFSGSAEYITTKRDMLHLGLEYYKGFINHDPVMTLTDFTARSPQVTYAENR